MIMMLMLITKIMRMLMLMIIVMMTKRMRVVTLEPACFCHRYYYNESFADIHKVAGLRGAFIASQLIAANGSFTVENQRSLITYDKGGEWELLNSPRELHGRPNINCTKVSCVEKRNSFIVLFSIHFFFYTSGRDTIIPP